MNGKRAENLMRRFSICFAAARRGALKLDCKAQEMVVSPSKNRIVKTEIHEVHSLHTDDIGVLGADDVASWVSIRFKKSQFLVSIRFKKSQILDATI